MKYEEALETIEKFNTDSGLRDFCTDACKGSCCWECTDHCFKRGERRIVCSTFFCVAILNIIFPDKKELRRYKDLQGNMKKHVSQYDKAKGPVFFKRPTDEELTNLQKSEIPDSVKYLADINTDKIREVVHNITPSQLYHLQNHEKEIRENLKNRRLSLDKRTNKT